jgi:hypothetical protein
VVIIALAAPVFSEPAPAVCPAVTFAPRSFDVLQGMLVPLAHRLRHYRTMHYELTPVPG